jgi:hypothetical protein
MSLHKLTAGSGYDYLTVFDIEGHPEGTAALQAVKEASNLLALRGWEFPLQATNRCRDTGQSGPRPSPQPTQAQRQPPRRFGHLNPMNATVKSEAQL